jgi:hypothetical protein
MSTEVNRKRALRYRALALADADPERANLLNKIADEAERGVLVSTERRYRSRPSPPFGPRVQPT